MKVSLVLLATPLIFSGCMQEKVSKVSPPSHDKNHNKITTTQNESIINSYPSATLEVKKNDVNNVDVIESREIDTLDSSDSILVTNEGVKLLPDTDQNDLMLDTSILDDLALDIQENISMDLTGDKEIVTESLEVGENWEPLTDWEPFTKEDELLETAKEYLGVPYIWAANGPSAFDCSGYTKYVFKQNGITIPRYSGHQANVGTKVSYDELQKGDLVFFDTAKGFHRKVNHVGIYIGDNKFIHASSARKKVMITSFAKKKFYKNRFLHGRRIIHSDVSFASYDNQEPYTIQTN